MGAHDWVGELAANGSVVPLFPSTATKKQFPGYALDSFSYGTAVKKLYGAPVALENIALVTNTKLAKVPKTWNQLEAAALATKKKTKAAVGISVQQGSGGDAYHMYPLFAGLCGFIFGKNSAGNLDPSAIGRCEREIPEERRARRPVEQDRPHPLERRLLDLAGPVPEGEDGVLVHGAVEPRHAQEVGPVVLACRPSRHIVQGCKAVPFLGVQGFMVTKFAATHGTESLAKDLVSSYMMQTPAQLELALANGRYPANLNAGKQVRDPQLRAFGAASSGGVPMPNIPQMNNVWGDLGAAWVRSTKGSGSVPARRSFVGAQRSIAQKIG